MPVVDLQNTFYKFKGDTKVTLPSYNLNVGKIELVPVKNEELVVRL